jgi:hypothetical protein
LLQRSEQQSAYQRTNPAGVPPMSGMAMELTA